jgi:peroxiredoxin
MVFKHSGAEPIPRLARTNFTVDSIGGLAASWPHVAEKPEASYLYCVRNLLELPSDLPVPEDDGACSHLPGMLIPTISLPSTAGSMVTLAETRGRTVVYCFPRMGQPDQPVPKSWDAIPGARGCTPQSCSFRDHYQELTNAGAFQVFGLSAQDTDYQREAVERLHLPFSLLSDPELHFANALKLPTFRFDAMTLIKRLTMIIDDGRITKVFYPVFPPDKSAEQTLQWLMENPAAR